MTRWLRSPLLISAVAHVVVLFGLIQLFAMPNPLRSWLERERVEFQVERIGYISLPATSRVSTAGRRGGDDRPAVTTPAIRPPVPAAVTSAPSITPSASGAPVVPGATEGGSGPIIGGGGQLRGIQPSFHDPRLWTIPDQIVTAPKSASERIDSVFAERVAQARDSAAASGPRAPSRDWTIGSGNRKFGVDSTGIRIAGITVPFVTLPPAGRMEEARRSMATRMEIGQQSVRRMNEDEFRQAAQRIRERKDREREQRMEAKKEIAAPVGSSDR